MPFDLLAAGTHVFTAAGGAVMLWLAQWLKDRGVNKKLDREVRHLGLEIADELEQYAAHSTQVASDISDHIGQQMDGVLLGLATLPTLPTSHERWRDLDLKIANEIKQLQDARRAYERRISGVVEYVGHEEAQDETYALSLVLAVHALQVASRVRKRYGHPKFETKAYWPTFLTESYEALPVDTQKIPSRTLVLKQSRWWRRLHGVDIS